MTTEDRRTKFELVVILLNGRWLHKTRKSLPPNENENENDEAMLCLLEANMSHLLLDMPLPGLSSCFNNRPFKVLRLYGQASGKESTNFQPYIISSPQAPETFPPGGNTHVKSSFLAFIINKEAKMVVVVIVVVVVVVVIVVVEQSEGVFSFDSQLQYKSNYYASLSGLEEV
ncbi:hypothetical protein V1477_001104 [Vespula maculifrons]|uniref:Uncharacterized protein n=1 Tax=Vespula maculifrons TaxID=7453 RepID=A0ABD2D0V5_VESMC